MGESHINAFLKYHHFTKFNAVAALNLPQRRWGSAFWFVYSTDISGFWSRLNGIISNLDNTDNLIMCARSYYVTSVEFDWYYAIERLHAQGARRVVCILSCEIFLWCFREAVTIRETQLNWLHYSAEISNCEYYLQFL